MLYRPAQDSDWDGRIDDLHDVDSFRWHQIVHSLDLRLNTDRIGNPDSINICFLGFSCDEGVLRNKGRVGTAAGPASLRREMGNLPCNFEANIGLFDAGDVLCKEGNLEEAQNLLAKLVCTILSLDLFPIILGGGHEIALGHYLGLERFFNLHVKQTGTRLGIINFDAHLDLRAYEEGGSSGSMFMQIADHCQRRGSPFSYFCLGTQISANTVQLFKAARHMGVTYVLARDVTELNTSTITKRIDEFIKQQDALYITVCMDVFSAAYSPGVSAPQPFGIYPETGLTLLKQIFKSGKVCGFDIAEVSPRFDEDSRTAKLAAIIVFTLMNSLSGKKNS